MINKLAKLGDAIAISKSETMNHSLTGVGAIASKKYNRHIYVSSFQNKCLFEVFFSGKYTDQQKGDTLRHQVSVNLLSVLEIWFKI